MVYITHVTCTESAEFNVILFRLGLFRTAAITLFLEGCTQEDVGWMKVP